MLFLAESQHVSLFVFSGIPQSEQMDNKTRLETKGTMGASHWEVDYDEQRDAGEKKSFTN